jgi:hypothetical protein
MSDPQSTKVMAAIDRLSPDFRTLVHEFGAIIVTRMMADGYSDAKALRDALVTWRERQQQIYARPLLKRVNDTHA